jgi:hypothetical protein
LQDAQIDGAKITRRGIAPSEQNRYLDKKGF